MLRHAGKTAAGMLPTALIGGLGLPAWSALVFRAVVRLGVICWIISRDDRAGKVTRMMHARLRARGSGRPGSKCRSVTGPSGELSEAPSKPGKLGWAG